VKRINKILLSRYSYSITVLYLLFFLFLSSGKELLHNHKPNERERNDCPALIISHTFSSGITINIEFQNEFIVESNIDTPQIFLTSQHEPAASYSRGPPLI